MKISRVQTKRMSVRITSHGTQIDLIMIGETKNMNVSSVLACSEVKLQ